MYEQALVDKQCAMMSNVLQSVQHRWAPSTHF